VINQRRWSGFCVAAAMVFGGLIRFIGIGRLSLWFDEGYTAWLVNHPFGELIRLVRADTSPPLYYILLHFWTSIFGSSEIALRSLSAIFGIAAIALVAAIARRLPVHPAGAAWIFALSWWQVDYSQEARSYEMTVLLAALMLYSLVRHLQKPDWRWLVLLIIAGTCGLYANNFMPLYIAALAAVAMILPSAVSTQRRLRDGAIVTSALAVIYIPWVASLASQIQRVQKDFWIPRPGLLAICEELARICGIEHFWTWDRYLHWLMTDTSREVPVVAASLLTIGLIIAFFGKQRRLVLALAVAGLAPPLLAALISQGPRSIFLPAAFVPSSVMLAVLMAGTRRWITIIIVALIAINLLAFEIERTKEDWRGAAQVVTALPPVPHRLIIFVANEGQLPFDYYYRRRAGEIETGAPAGFFDIDPPRTQLRVLADGDLDSLRKQIATGEFDDVVLVAAHTDYSDPLGRTATYLRDTLHLAQRTELSNEISILEFK